MKKKIYSLFMMIGICVCMMSLKCHAKFFSPTESDIDYRIHEINVNGHNIKLDATHTNSGAIGTLSIDGKIIDSRVASKFISNGETIYYNKNGIVYKYNISSDYKDIILNDGYLWGLEGCYNDKYLYYTSDKYGDVTRSIQDLIIYDLEHGKEISYVVDVAALEIESNKIFVIPCCGDVTMLEIRMMNPDGSNCVVIANDATDMKAINGVLYYGALTEDSYPPNSYVKCYDIHIGNTTILTDSFYNTYVYNLFDSHAIFNNIETSKLFNVNYKNLIKVVLNNDFLAFEQRPVIIEGRTLVPLRAIFEAMGATVYWDGNTKTVTCTKGNTTISLTIGNNILYKNGAAILLDVPAQIINDYTMIPVRAITEAMGANVSWDDTTKTVYIVYNL